MEKLLEKIGSPADLKKLKISELSQVCGEIREEIISSVSENGGHPSSALGAVEAIVALHYVYDFKTDKLVFDVGHQAYAHKLVTGRREAFRTMRKEGGISGFTSVGESVYDAYTTGHAGTSISAALGYCFARDLKKEDYSVVCFVGDASFFNGENLEAIFSSAQKPDNFLIVYNDNGMGISPAENGVCRSLEQSGVLEKAVESFGLDYYSEPNGNDEKELIAALLKIKNSKKAALLHIKTVKGKGLAQAENNAEYYHGVGGGLTVKENSFADSVSPLLLKFCKENPKITAICAGMKFGTGLSEFAEKYPERFFDAGICEEFAVSFASGAALAGLKPVVFIYSTFLQRAFDQIITDVCLQKLPVIFMVDRAGVVGADGQTHQGVFDLSYLRQIPDITIFAPKDVAELEICFKRALELNSPVAIRYPCGKAENFGGSSEITGDFLWEVYNKTGNPVNIFNLSDSDRHMPCIIAAGGRALKIAFEAAGKSEVETLVINARVVKPLDEKVLFKIAEISGGRIVTVEENVIAGGFGESVLAFYAKNNVEVSVKTFGVQNCFVSHAEISRQLELNGITASAIAEFLSDFPLRDGTGVCIAAKN